MLSSRKWKILNFILFIIASVSFASCIRGPSDPNSHVDGTESIAAYKPLEMSGESITQKENSIWKVPTKKTYQYKVCLISRNTNSMVPGGQEFYIEKPDKTRVLEKTNNLGCLVWSEDLSYDYTSDSVYVEIKRNLIGKGTHKGIVPLRFAVNPWLKDRGESGLEFVDLNQGDKDNPIVAQSLISELASSGRIGMFSRSSGKALLIEESPSVLIRSLKDIKDGKRLEVIFDAHPYINPLNLNQEKIKIDLTSGEYEVYVQLIANYLSPQGDKAVNLIAPELPMKLVQSKGNGLLRYQQTVDLKHKVSSGRLELAIKIVPKNAPFEIFPFEGLYEIGEFTKLYREGSVKQVRGIYSDQSKPFIYSQFLQKEVSNYDDLADAEWVKKLPPVNYDHLTPRFVRVKGQGETATERTIIYRISTRVTDSVTGAAIVDQKFKIKRQDGEEIEATSNHNGLLHWTNTIHHHYYQPEQFYLRDVKITHVNSSKEETYQLALNPWDSGWTFGMDSRDRASGFSDAELGSSKKLLAPLLMVDAFRYQTIRFRYVIDEFLTLNVKKAVVMALDPLVQKQTINRGRQFEPLRDGIYLAKIALVKYYMDPFQQGLHLLKDEEGKHEIHRVNEGKISDFKDARKGEYTSIIKKLIRVQAGRITTPLEFSMRDLRMMSIRSNIMVQLETIDENLLLQDNIINSRLNELERQYNEYNCVGPVKKEDCLTESEKEALLARLAKEKEEGIDRYKAIIGNHLAVLKRSREAQGDLMEQRDNIIKGLEDGLAPEKDIRSVYGDRSIFDLPQGEARALIQSARDNISDLARNMQNYWGDWDKSWLSESEANVPNNLQISAIQENRYSHMQYNGDSASAEKKEERRSLEKKSYEDYLANMQVFLRNLHPDLSINERDLEALERNNYRENPAIPIIDLNLYRNGDISGLKSRTFIGPCTLVANDNMSELRPTDTIDEGECWGIDCHDRSQDAEETRESVDNSEFEKSAYHDSLIPFTNKKVDDFVDDHYRNEQNYKRKMEILSQMGNFVTAFNMDFVSLRDEPLMIYKDNCKFDEVNDYSECFTRSTKNVYNSQDFLSLIKEEKFETLLQRYFYVNPLGRQQRVNNEIDELTETNPSQNLEPLFPRAGRVASEILYSRSSNAGYNRFYDESLIYGPGGHPYQFDRWKLIKDHYKDKVPSPRKLSDVRRWLIDGRESLKLEDALPICHALATHVSDLLDKNKMIDGSPWLSGLSPKENAFIYLRDICFEQIKYMPNQDQVYFAGVSFDRRYKILETGPYEHIAGKNMNLNVGIDFGILGYGDSQTIESIGLSASQIVGIGIVGVGAVIGAPIAIAAGIGAFISGTILYSGSVNSVEGTMKTTGTSVNAATFLVVQEADMEITIEKHLKCLSTQFSNDLVLSLDHKRLGIKDSIKSGNKDLQKTLTRGFFICDNQETSEPEKVMENYYYVTQHFTAGDMLDDVNLLNHVWLLALRGKRDFNSFLRTMKGREIDNKGEVIQDSDLYDYSLQRLGDVYNKALPTFPGMYSVHGKTQKKNR